MYTNTFPTPPKYESTIDWRVVSHDELLSLIANTIDETIIQHATVAYGFASLLKEDVGEKRRTSSQKTEYSINIMEASTHVMGKMRCIQNAIVLQRLEKTIPIKRHGTKNIIDLSLLKTSHALRSRFYYQNQSS